MDAAFASSCDSQQAVQKLLEYLRAIEVCPDIASVEQDNKHHDLINKALYWADVALITETGATNVPALSLIVAAGYPVYAGEQDRHGWLTGCIETKKGVLVYG